MFKITVRLLFGIFLYCSAEHAMTDAANREGAARAMRERRLAPIMASGVNVESIDELKKALRHSSFQVQLGAVYLLREKKAASAVPELTALVKTAGAAPLLKAETCEALGELNPAGSEWGGPCQALLSENNDLTVRLKAAGALARAGNPEGWGLVKAKLLSSESEETLAAAAVAPAFEGVAVPQESNRRIHLPAVAAAVFAQAGESSQTALIMVMGNTATARDVQLLSGLVNDAKTPYLKDSIRAIVRQATVR